MILHLYQGNDIVSYPFKFNAVWLEDPDFINLVRINWAGLLGTDTLDPMDSLVKKLKMLKTMVDVWERKRRILGGRRVVLIGWQQVIGIPNFFMLMQVQENKSIPFGTLQRNMEQLYQIS